MPSDINAEEHQHAAHTHTVQCIRQITVMFITIISMLLTLLNTNIPEPYHTYIYTLWPRMGQQTPQRSPWAHSLWTGGKLGGIPSANYFAVWLWLWRLKICLTQGIFLYMFVTGLTIQHTGEHFQHSNKMSSKYFCQMLRILSSEPFYTAYICQPSWHGHPTIMKDSSQPQNVAILWACSRHSRWYSYFMFASIVQLTIISKLKGFYVPELSVHL